MLTLVNFDRKVSVKPPVGIRIPFVGDTMALLD